MTEFERHDSDVSSRTIAHYEVHAESYWNGTRTHDVSQNIGALLAHINATAPFEILDFGCGPGRDLKTFVDLGHHPIGLEGASRFVAMARSHSGCTVWQQNFLSLDLPALRFDGIFANATLFHVPSSALPQVLRALYASLKAGGVLFCSNPRGQNQEGWQGERYGTYADLAHWRRWVSAARFTEITHFYRPTGAPCAEQTWLATVWRKSEP